MKGHNFGKCRKCGKTHKHPKGLLKKGEHHTEETKAKMKERHIDFSGSNNPRYGKKHTEQTRKKISETRKKQGYTHSDECMCNFCKSKKGLLTKEKNPFFGKTHTKEAKQRISEANKGKKHSKETKEIWSKQRKGLLVGERNGMFGKCHTIESRKKMSLKLSKEKNPSWLGGVSFEPYNLNFTKQLRDEIKYRDNFLCVLCLLLEEEHNEKFGYGLTTHHIDYDKKNSVKNNLVTLCCSCNSTVNFSREIWQEFFEERMSDIYD